MSKLGLVTAALVVLIGCAPQAEVERRRAFLAQVDRNPPQFQAACEARAGARLIAAAPQGGVVVQAFRWPEDQDLLFVWGAPFVEITNPHQRTLGVEEAPDPGPLGLGPRLSVRPEPVRAPAPGDASIAFRVRLLPDGDARCAAGNSQRNTAIEAGRPGEEARWNRSGNAWPFTDARHQTDAAYYRGQCLAVVDATDGAAFHAPARYEFVSGQTSHGSFSAGGVEVGMDESWRRLLHAETRELAAEQASFGIGSVDRFANYMGNSFSAGVNRCTGAERGRPTSIFALRPFTPAPTN